VTASVEPSPEGVVLKALLAGIEAEAGAGFFRSLVRGLAEALDVDYAFVTEFDAALERFHSLAVFGRGAMMPDFDVPLAGTPCATVLAGEITHHPKGIQALFPEDRALVDWGVESYVGVPIVDRAGSVLGHFAILDGKPIADGSRLVWAMRTLAARVAAELERQRAEAALRESEERLSQLVESATDVIVGFDESGAIQVFNRAAERVLRCSRAEALAMPIERFVRLAGESPLLAELPRLVGREDGSFLGEEDGLVVLRADGTALAFEASLSGSEVGGGPLYTLILRDLEERRRAQQERAQLLLQSEYLQDEIRSYHNFDEIIGRSAVLAKVLEAVELVAPTDATVLVRGETGTGKEMIARAIHARSARSERPLIKVNCAALPAGVLESELFGHEKGSFTGAVEARVGRFEIADGGTIFLDEIGELPLEAQTKLLRILQEREFERVGGSRTRKVDVRVIAATNRDLRRESEGGAFREDLFYRLNVFPITMPSLRERPEDIPLLVHWFVQRHAKKIGRTVERVSAQTMRRLTAYSWPGNVRELENVIERALILACGPELEVEASILSEEARPPAASASASGPTLRVPSRVKVESSGAPSSSGSLEDVEREHILEVLRQTGRRIDGANGAARVLELNPSTLRSRIKKLGIRRSSDVA